MDMTERLGHHMTIVYEDITYEAPYRHTRPYFECNKEQWELYTAGMTERGKRQLANMVAHHMLLAKRDKKGWMLTRSDLIMEGRPFWHVSNDGELTYNYTPIN